MQNVQIEFLQYYAKYQKLKFSASISIIISPSLFLSQLATCTDLYNGWNLHERWFVMSWQIAILIICCCCTQEKVNQDNQNDNEPWLKWVITIVGNCHFIMENSRVYENCKTTYSIVVNIRALIHVDYLTTNETTTTVNSQKILYVWNRYYSYIFIIEQNCMYVSNCTDV